ncbi:MAG: hypothetical protein K2X47_09180, partial [Bdellovibrionales bacterium]|nr:hypothetical protein [Bdellovibrionales bacterium]
MSEENRVNQIDVQQVSDGELMELYKSGRMESFQILYNRHSAKVYGYFRGRLKNRAQADDLFQATFLKLHSHRQ